MPNYISNYISDIFGKPKKKPRTSNEGFASNAQKIV